METPVPGQVGRLWDRGKYSENLNHTPEKVTEFHTKNPVKRYNAAFLYCKTEVTVDSSLRLNIYEKFDNML